MLGEPIIPILLLIHPALRLDICEVPIKARLEYSPLRTGRLKQISVNASPSGGSRCNALPLAIYVSQDEWTVVGVVMRAIQLFAGAAAFLPGLKSSRHK